MKVLCQILNDSRARTILDSIESMKDRKEPAVIRVKMRLIKQLEEEFDYRYNQ